MRPMQGLSYAQVPSMDMHERCRRCSYFFFTPNHRQALGVRCAFYPTSLNAVAQWTSFTLFHVPALWPRTQPVALTVGVSCISWLHALCNLPREQCDLFQARDKKSVSFSFFFFFPFWISGAVSLVLCRFK